MIKGLTYQDNFITPEGEAKLIGWIDLRPWSNTIRRRTQHYGYVYDYKKRAINLSMKTEDLPDWGKSIAAKLYEEKLMPYLADQMIINEYQPGQGIAPHVDCEPCFEDTIVSISLGSGCDIDFSPVGNPRRILTQWLAPQSALAITGEARYQWRHGIVGRKTDVYQGIEIERTRRISLTFRKVILEK